MLTVRPPDLVALLVSDRWSFLGGRCHPSHSRWVFQKILCYLKGAPGHDILYSNHGHNRLRCFTDANWAGSKEDRRSTSGYFVFVRGNLVSWKSKKQSFVSQYSAESKYRAMTQSACEIMWLHQLLAEVIIKTSVPTKLWCDNQIAFILPLILFSMNKLNTEIVCHFVHEKIQLDLISTGYVKTGEQLGDIFTNALSGGRVSYQCNKLGMINIYALT